MNGPILALVPAKAASNRLKRKNALIFEGEPLVVRAVRTAKDAGIFSDIVVSTEDSEIADLARSAGAHVPFMRPHALSVDPAGVVEVTLHALDKLQQTGRTFETVVILLPTSPLRNVEDIHEAVRIYRERGVKFLMSVTRYEHTPLAALVLENGLLHPLLPEMLARTGAKAAETPNIVRSNGAVTICNVEQLRKEKNYYAYPLAAYEMPWERSIDIDTEADLAMAEYVSGRK